MYDILIKNGTVVDGTGNPRFKADVAIAGGRIVKIAEDIEASAGEIVDATGHIVSPGFIDGHTHSDLAVVLGSDSWNHLENGVTTQIAGQCGGSPCPYSELNVKALIEDIEEDEQAKVFAFCENPHTFMAQAESAQSGTNFAFYIGHGALRAHGMGYSDQKPTADEMADMKNMLTQAMEAGFLGYSSGLVYAPSVYGDADELTELAAVMKPYNGVYTSHIRAEGDAVVRAVEEAIAVGEGAGVQTVISHLKVMGRHNKGASKTTLALIEAANARGVSVYADQYPFIAGAAPLSSQIPPKYLVGGIPALLERIKSPEIRQQIVHSIFHEPHEFESSIYTAGFEGAMVVSSPKAPQFAGKTIAQIAQETGKEPIDAYCDLLLENEGMGSGVYFNQVEEDMLRILAHPLVTAGSDWSDIKERKGSDSQSAGHPRSTSTMIRRLELTRDLGLRTLESVVRSMTGLTALSVGLPGRGILAEGRPADVTIFDYAAVKMHADFMHPFRKNDGIHTVIVNGQVAVREGTALGVRAGTVLKRGQ